jgi:CBS domain-containing protein
MTQLRRLPLVRASVHETATFGDAALELTRAGVPAIAVLDAQERVRGVFTSEGLLRGWYPPYLAELRHTAFLDDDAMLAERADEVRGEPVRPYVERVESLDSGDSRVHAAERFLHAKVDALPVVDEGRFLGMLSIGALCAATVEHLAGSQEPQDGS